jgi:anti-anti-sigma regulatory factor
MTEIKTEGEALRLSGAVTIREGEALKNDLLARLKPGARVDVDLAAVEDADLGIVQLLLAADISAAKTGAGLRVLRPLPDAIQQLLARCGFPSELVGPLDPTANIWTREA